MCLWSEEGSRRSPFRLANTSTSRGQGISIMPFQNAESQTHRSQDGWCFLSRNRKVFVDLFVFLHAAPNNINLTTSSLNLCSLLCLSIKALWTSFAILFMSGSLSVEKFWGQTANYFRKQQRKEGWKVRQSIIQAASLMGPVRYDNRPLSILPWLSAVCVKMCIVKVTRNLRYTVNKTFWVWRYTYMWADLMRAEVVFMGQSDLFRVQWALSLAGGEHSPAQSPPLCPGHAQPSPGARPSMGTQTHRWTWLMCWTSPTRTSLSPLSKPLLHPPSNLAYFCPSLVCVCV